jgi:hypothetical protein
VVEGVESLPQKQVQNRKNSHSNSHIMNGHRVISKISSLIVYML